MELTPEQRVSHADTLLNNPLFADLIARAEALAIDRAIYAKPGEDTIRAEALIEARVIRNLRSQLRGIAAEAKEASRSAPA